MRLIVACCQSKYLVDNSQVAIMYEVTQHISVGSTTSSVSLGTAMAMSSRTYLEIG